MTDDDALESRLRKSLRADLPPAPASLVARLDADPELRATWPRPRLSLLVLPAALGVAILAIALGSGGKPEPSTSIGPSAPSSTSTESASPQVAVPSAGEPTATLGTPAQTAVPVTPWAQHAVEAVPGPANMTDVWAVGKSFIGIVWMQGPDGDRTQLVRSENGVTWFRMDPPRPDFVAGTGTVTKGELHILGYTGTFAEATWWRYATDGATWREAGALSGIPASTYVLELVTSDAGWLARVAVHRVDFDGELDVTTSELRWSADGLGWEEPPLPATDGLVFYTGVATDGRSLHVLRYPDPRGDPYETVGLVSEDGRRWTEHPISTLDGGPRFMATDGGRFVAVGSKPEPPDWPPAVWRSEDGDRWVEAKLHRLSGPGSSGLRMVVSTDVGFVAFGAAFGDVWVSTDGVEWRSFAVLPEGREWFPFAVAVLGDTVVVGGSGADSEPTVWVGRLSDLVDD